MQDFYLKLVVAIEEKDKLKRYELLVLFFFNYFFSHSFIIGTWSIYKIIYNTYIYVKAFLADDGKYILLHLVCSV